MLIEKYSPKSLNELLGNKKQISELILWIKKGKPPVLLSGPTGSGKSIIPRLLAKYCGFELIELTPSDITNEHILKASKQKSLFYKGKLILIEDVDAYTSRIDLSKIQYPIIFTCTNPYDKKLKIIRKRCKIIRLYKIRYDIIAKFLKFICKKEHIRFEEKAIYQLARMCNGDVRSALIDLELLMPDVTYEKVQNLYPRMRDKNIFDVIRTLLYTTNFDIALETINNTEKTPEELFLWLEENILKAFDGAERAKAMKHMATADLFNTYVTRRQVFSLMKYFILEMCFACISGKPRNTVKLLPPQVFVKKKKVEDAVLSRLANELHCSKKTVIEYLPILEKLNLDIK